MTSMNLRTRRSLAAAAVILGSSLVVAGCGGSSKPGTAKTSSTGAKTSASAAGTTTKASPPPPGPALEAGLVKTMAHNQPTLTHVKPRCPSGQATHYPVICRFTATEVVKKFKKTYHMAGTITVAAAQGTHYEYGLNYAPTK
jgi:hypothetical protein